MQHLLARFREGGGVTPLATSTCMTPRLAIPPLWPTYCQSIEGKYSVYIYIKQEKVDAGDALPRVLGPEHTGHFVQPQVAALCGGDIYSRRKPLFSSFGEHTAVCGSSVRQLLVPATDRAFAYITYMSPPHVALVCPPQCAATCGWTKWPVCYFRGRKRKAGTK